MTFEIILYRDTDPTILSTLLRNTRPRLPLPFRAEDRVTEIGKIVNIFVRGDCIVGIVEAPRIEEASRA